ncbi:hypothetical protein ACTVKO_23840 [Serratia nevei]|uniref:hypothetical protein n=1 Tax=Serratia nevei TaxID=2703794 RepID=UPI003FA748DF
MFNTLADRLLQETLAISIGSDEFRVLSVTPHNHAEPARLKLAVSPAPDPLATHETDLQQLENPEERAVQDKLAEL